MTGENIPHREEKITYTEPLTGTLAEEADPDPLGIPYTPLARMWQVNPGAEAIPRGAESELTTESKTE
ncbi:hypothetical protein KDJ56_04335 [Brevibacillus composti]|uniref:Uncharacterized protein n=1 Tax=Brevibacillus composti TaxID=2796470 RepID=A0A7T5JPE2_9BACL|nr:hypothetical protein [Brevibacillus composti]QQE75164.1 hypothetical protein JD108_04335 [Brevibacillus composti]QUO42252.1 hypothetical protein KDJ56_04335 [Brevibacillus composti]